MPVAKLYVSHLPDLPMNLITIFSLIVFTFCFGSYLLPYLNHYFVAVPNSRSSHSKATPSAGGIIFIVPILIYLLLFSNNLGAAQFLISSLPLVIISLLDDYKTIKPRIRLPIQALSCSTAIYIIAHYQINGFLADSGWIMYVLIFILYISFVNFINFTDGIDGLVGGSMLVSFCILWISPLDISFFVIMIPPLFVFLLFNWSPAKVFMGDIGSTFLAFSYFYCSLNSGSILLFLSTIALLSPICIDALICMVRRILAKQNIFEAHKLHLFQRLCLNGYSHASVSTVYILCSMLLGILYLMSPYLVLLIGIPSVLVTGFIMEFYYASPFEGSEKG